MNRETTGIVWQPQALLSPEDLNAVLDEQIAVSGLLGVGASGAVYRAQQIRLSRTVAVKVLFRLGQTAAGDLSERFVWQARAMARLDHPNIAKVHDIGETRTGLPYLVMEHVEGVDWATLILGGQLTLEHLTSWVSQACEALEYAHNHELVHGDIKPSNLMVDLEGRVKITDFGLVRSQNQPDRASLAREPLLLGTRSYLAPEVLEEGAPVDHRADIYSMGVVVYEMLTGGLPKGSWVPPSQVRRNLNPRFDDIVIRALQPDPGQRHSRIADLGREILAAAHDTAAGKTRMLLTEGGGRARRLRIPAEESAEESGELPVDSPSRAERGQDD